MVYNFIRQYARLLAFKKQWRRLNGHNLTIAKNYFPSDKVMVGSHTYGPLEVYSWGTPGESLSIGSFCSIAMHVKFLLGGNHSSNSLLTYPLGTQLLGLPDEAATKGPVSVGDDVWIGMGAMILSGVSIGRGAVIAAGAVVTKDVPPYAIAGGNPAKVIKYRFSDTVIGELMQLDFSRIDASFARQHLQLLHQGLSAESLHALKEALSR